MRFFVLVASPLVALSSSTAANQLPQRSFEEMVAEADVVTIARSHKPVRVPEGKGYSIYMDMATEVVLKGSSPTRIRVRMHGGVSELGAGSMPNNRRFLLLLSQESGEYYRPVNGFRSVYLLKK